MSFMLRRFFLLSAVGALSAVAACTNSNDLDKAPVPLGQFALGHNVVVAPNLTKGPVSREATKEEWIAAMKAAVDERFGRYEGDRFYHFGISVEGYVLAPPGIPLVASPKSILIFNVTIWDDAAGKKMNEEVKQITVFESAGAGTLVGSGYTMTREEQIQNLARNGVKEIEKWLRHQKFNEGWFADTAKPARVAKADATKVEEE